MSPKGSTSPKATATAAKAGRKTGRRRTKAPPRLSAEQAAIIFDRLGELNPEPRTELEFVNDYTLLVAVVLSAQATDAGVNKATAALFARVQTPEAMLQLGLEGVRQHIRTIGLYNSKAKNVIRLSEQLIELHGGQVPRSREELMALAGVGRKTANVMLNEAFGEPTMAVDTHVYRVARRMGLSHGTTPLAVERDVLELVPARWGRAAHHLLILHGRYLCKARKPECWRCPVADLCLFEPKSPDPALSENQAGN